MITAKYSDITAYYYIITTTLLRNITKLLHTYYSLLLAANKIIFNYYFLMSFTTIITSSLLLITFILLRITPKPLLHITSLSVSNTTNYLRNVIRSNETITTYYVPGQLADVPDIGCHTNGLGESYDQTGSGAPEDKTSRLAWNYFGTMVHKYSGS